MSCVSGVLVIGGCGFIGSHIVDVLLEQGKSVRVLDRRPEVFRPPLAGVEYVAGDLSDPARMAEALIGMDTVLHLASTTVPQTSNLDPAADITDNLVASVRLLDVMRAVGVLNMVYLSSGGAIYGIPYTDPVAEDHPLQPISSYGIVKASFERYLHLYGHLYGLRSCVLRPANPYGPRQGHLGVQGVISTYLWKAKRGEQIEVWGKGDVVRDFIHVRDLAELCARAVNANQTGIFNAGSGEGVSIAQIVETVASVIDRPLQPIYKPSRSFDVPRVVLDISRAKAAFDWAPRISLASGIAETWEWVQKQPR